MRLVFVVGFPGFASDHVRHLWFPSPFATHPDAFGAESVSKSRFFDASYNPAPKRTKVA